MSHRAAGLGEHKRFRDQVRHAIDDRHRRDFVTRHDHARGLQCEAPGEDRQPAQHHALGFGQQLVAPVKCPSQGLMARQCGAAAPGKEPETVVEPGRKSLYPKRRGTGRRKLDRQRDAVETTTNSGDRERRACVRRKVRLGGAGPLVEQPDGAIAKRVLTA